MFDPVAYINEPRWRSMSLGLERIEELLAKLGNPQDTLRFVHVAGTNGKGSTCSFVSSILEESGYKVGLFTSPYIERFEERIRINGENISLQRLSEVTLKVKDAAEAMASHPTEFELMTAVAFTILPKRSATLSLRRSVWVEGLIRPTLSARSKFAYLPPFRTIIARFWETRSIRLRARKRAS